MLTTLTNVMSSMLISRLMLNLRDRSLVRLPQFSEYQSERAEDFLRSEILRFRTVEPASAGGVENQSESSATQSTETGLTHTWSSV